MLKIYIVRHGEDSDEAAGIISGQRDMPLTEKGLTQSEELTRIIWSHGLHFGAIYTSPLQRAYRCAEIITDTLELPKPVPRANLIERACGVMTGEPHASIEDACGPDVIKSAATTHFLHAHNAETFPELLARARAALDDIRANHGSQGQVLVVTHADFGKMLFAAYYNLEWQPAMSMFHFGHAELLELSEETSPASAQLYKKP
jgi:broad specificity phosphatase PhoE